MSCSIFSNQLKSEKVRDQNTRINNCGKLLKKKAGNCCSQFLDTKYQESRAVLSRKQEKTTLT